MLLFQFLILVYMVLFKLIISVPFPSFSWFNLYDRLRISFFILADDFSWFFKRNTLDMLRIIRNSAFTKDSLWERAKIILIDSPTTFLLIRCHSSCIQEKARWTGETRIGIADVEWRYRRISFILLVILDIFNFLYPLINQYHM